MKRFAREIALYGLASGVAFVFDVVLLAALVELAGIPYLPAAVLSFIAGGLVAYALCVRFIFRFHRVEDRRVEALAFVTLGLVGLAVNSGGIVIGVEFIGMHYLVAKVAAAAGSFIVSYALRRLALFTPLSQRTLRAS